jgi:hypothetical protein
MNERIKQLAEQAGMVKFPPSIETELQKNILFGDGQIEKFAELIVLECASAVNSRDDSDTGFWANIIKEHFGVKE